MLEFVWRKELWHPVTVHFPVALLLVATLIQITTVFVKHQFRQFFRYTFLLLLTLGTIGAWVALYTGDIADGVVARKICDPTLLKHHEIAAQTTTYLFTGALLIAVVNLRIINARLRLALSVVVFLLTLNGSFFLVRAAHAGAKVVYQQGGGVENHSVDCN